MTTMVDTTVIGSYPICTDNMKLMRSYFKGEGISWKEYIKHAVDDFLQAGLDMVADGQTRDPFITIFLRKLTRTNNFCGVLILSAIYLSVKSLT